MKSGLIMAFADEVAMVVASIFNGITTNWSRAAFG